MSDWLEDFDNQCRSEGLEVPKKNEDNGKQPSSETMEQSEENRGFSTTGTARGGAFGSGKSMNAPPPQTSFGSTSGTRMGGSFGSAQTADARGSPLGSAEDGGGNTLSVGNHRDKSMFTRGGGFGTNRSMAPSAPATIKNNYKGGRFGSLAPRTFGVRTSEQEEKKSNAGSSFSSEKLGTSPRSEQSLPGDSLGTGITSSSSTSSSSVGGAFGARRGNIDGKIATVGGSFGASRATGSSISGLNNASKSITSGGFSRSESEETGQTTSVGGAFGSKLPSKDLNAAPVPKDSDPKPPSGGAFGSRQTMGGAFGATRGGAFGKKAETLSTEDYSKPPPSVSIFSRNSSPVKGLNENKDEDKPLTENGKSFDLDSQISQEIKVNGGSALKPDNRSITDPEATFGGGFTTRAIGGSFGKCEVNNRSSVGGGFCAKPAGSNTSIIGSGFSPSSSVGSIRKSFGSELKSENLDLSENHATSKSKFGGGFPTSGFSGTVNHFSSESKKQLGIGNEVGHISNENQNPFSTNSGTSRRGFGDTYEKPTFALRGSPFDTETRSNRGGFNDNHSIFENRRIHYNAPFIPGQQSAIRGGYRGGFRGGRGGGGHMDFNAGQGHGMGRGQIQQGQHFVPQQKSTPPLQSVVPDSKYKYTKPVDEMHEKVPVPADIALLNKYIQKEVKMMKDMVVDVQRLDPTSPLYSISSFRELRLKPEVLQALDQLNFQFPTRIQETALPLLLMEPPSNLIAQAQSGTGKTAAFVLTMLCRIDVNLNYPQCICLAPTLELAKQIGEVVEKMGKYMENLKIHYAIKGGNMAAMRGRKLTEQIVIGTPSTTKDYLQKYKCIDPAMIRCLVLDEADVMIYQPGFTDISTSIYNMVEEASESVQSMLFSATYDEPVINFATKIIKNAIVVMLKREEQALPNIKQFYVQCASRDSKYAAIVNLYSGLVIASSVIFCHTKASVMWLFENMRARGHQVDVLHGDMSVADRADTIIRFKRGDFKVLITTNVFARGIDVPQVSVVINYDLPIKYNVDNTPMVVDGFTQPDCETYLHRIGRTGRFGKTGIAINFIDSEDSMNMINVLENHFQMKIARMDPSNLVELEAIEMA